MYSQAWGISVITDTPFNGDAVPAMYTEKETTEIIESPTGEPMVEVEEVSHDWMTVPALLIGLAVIVLLIPTKKEKKRGA